MTPKERIKAIRLMEKIKHHPELCGRIGVEINFIIHSAEQSESSLREHETV